MVFPREHTEHDHYIITRYQYKILTGPRAGNLTPGNTNNDSLCAPGHYKVVKNMAHNATRAVGMHTVSVSNCRVPDDLLHAIAELNNDENVQFVGFSRKSKPFVIAYKPEQLTDMKRFCSTATPPYLRTVLGVDRTFNLGPCFVTCIVGLYKNMSVKRLSTQAFLGPILLHFDALTESETYRCLFSNVADAMGAPTYAQKCWLLIWCFGSDDEKALVNVLHTALPAADHVYRARPAPRKSSAKHLSIALPLLSPSFLTLPSRPLLTLPTSAFPSPFSFFPPFPSLPFPFLFLLFSPAMFLRLAGHSGGALKLPQRVRAEPGR